MRTIGVVTVGRSDYGIYLPLLRRIKADDSVRLHLFVSGGHLWKEQGRTIQLIRRDGFRIGTQVAVPYASDRPEGIVRTLADEVAAFGRAYSKARPDILVVLGDRFEMYAAALAALPFGIPVAHVHGGELTLGVMDDAFRHSMTKLSHLHFASTAEYAARIRQLGEEAWRVRVSGALGLEGLRRDRRLSRSEIEARWKVRLVDPFLLVTFHPETLRPGESGRQIREVLAAIGSARLPAVFTLPNADTDSGAIAMGIRGFVRRHPESSFIPTLGREGYFGLMSLAAAMVGNSSSGILEAASFQLPVINIGDRQGGRLRARNLIDVPCRRGPILAAIRRAVGPAFRRTLRWLRNPYERSNPSATILSELKRVRLDERLVMKRFVDIEVGR